MPIIWVHFRSTLDEARLSKELQMQCKSQLNPLILPRWPLLSITLVHDFAFKNVSLSFSVLGPIQGSEISQVAQCKESSWQAGEQCSIPGPGWSPGEGDGNPLQYFCPGNAMERGAWWAIVHGVTRVRLDLRTKQQRGLETGEGGSCSVPSGGIPSLSQVRYGLDYVSFSFLQGVVLYPLFQDLNFPSISSSHHLFLCAFLHHTDVVQQV